MTGTILLRCRNCHQIMGELRDSTVIDGWEWCNDCIERERLIPLRGMGN